MLKSNAPGQLLGYSIQYPRALCHLLNAEKDDVTSIEVLGDVATANSAETTTEEDKSSLGGNPLTNRSTDLWKTFANWKRACQSLVLNVNSTNFVLYANKSGDAGIVDLFAAATDSISANAALAEAKAQLNDIKSGHAIWDDFNYVVNSDVQLTVQIIEHFQLEIGDGAGYSDVASALENKFVPHGVIEHLIHSLNGWLVKIVSERIAAGQQANIRWEEFREQFLVFFERARQLELVDFTSELSLGPGTIDHHKKHRPQYLRQLQSIEVDENEIVEAVTDFLKAKFNRDKWIEAELIDEDVARDFEKRLVQFWKNYQKRIELTETSMTSVQHGQLLLAECKMRNETIRGAAPPSSTVAGTYHALADVRSVWWHPDWEKLCGLEGEHE